MSIVDWSSYRACPVCKTPLGGPCTALSGMVVGGRPDGVLTELDHAHGLRKLRVARRRAK